jgi:hypothetical protein
MGLAIVSEDAGCSTAAAGASLLGSATGACGCDSPQALKVKIPTKTAIVSPRIYGTWPLIIEFQYSPTT